MVRVPRCGAVWRCSSGLPAAEREYGSTRSILPIENGFRTPYKTTLTKHYGRRYNCLGRPRQIV